MGLCFGCDLNYWTSLKISFMLEAIKRGAGGHKLGVRIQKTSGMCGSSRKNL